MHRERWNDPGEVEGFFSDTDRKDGADSRSQWVSLVAEAVESQLVGQLW